MVTRQKLELEINKPVQVQLLYDECVSGQNQFGPYFLYAIKSNNQEYSYFANETVHEQLKNLKAGDVATITKLAAQRGNKLITKYVVENNSVASQEIKPTPEEMGQSDDIEEIQNQTDNLYSIMLNCYKDAFQIQKYLNGMVDIEKIAITLFIARSRK